jgi:hypothetical protein
MQCNVGQSERIVRIVVGVAIIVAGVMFQSWWGAIGLIPLLTGAVRYCPAWQLFGVNTARQAKS